MPFFKKKVPQSAEVVANNDEFSKFRGNVPLQRATVGLVKPRTWKFYDYGDESKAPLVMLPPVGGTAEVFFKLFNALFDKGIRIIAVQNPPINDHDEWIESFSSFLDHIKIKRVHLLGCGLGGFLSLLFTRIHPKRVISTILINSFSTNVALQTSVSKYEFAPAFVLKNLIIQNYQKPPAPAVNIAAVDFYTKQVETLTQEEIFSGISLSSTEAYIDKRKVNSKTLTILESDDFSSLNPQARGTCSASFPSASTVPLKRGGDFPFISVAEEIALYINVHMRRLDPSLLPAITIDSTAVTFSHDRGGKKFGKSVISAPVKGSDEGGENEDESSSDGEEEKKKSAAGAASSAAPSSGAPVTPVATAAMTPSSTAKPSSSSSSTASTAPKKEEVKETKKVEEKKKSKKEEEEEEDSESSDEEEESDDEEEEEEEEEDKKKSKPKGKKVGGANPKAKAAAKKENNPDDDGL